ncbi:MAG TPA: ammonium transporter [Oscillospiraceae bacterium]|nr:ammonium transporter [Oscillospiraceae bacterium]HPF56146.1 ammonium transporter [Clostridiales bacterium]HPK35978.1 ammonium transporter [Oscillospiraceae bacterium]HPR76236.1 ammonium transporter [Oscillospiraceae bacterium]
MDNITVLFSDVDNLWVLIAAALVFFMQAGFAMVETGFTRSKNAGNIIMKNLMDFSIGTPLYWLAGFGIMFGTQSAIFGGIDLFTRGDYSAVLPAGVSLPAFLIFQTVFCATAATIVSGAMAERTKFSSYCIYSAMISLLIYPISGHWIWGGGWLAGLGFHDFAGSTAVHMLGGVAALVGAIVLGPRIGKYDKDGKSRAIPGHSITLGALGVFILWFCWFGFNGGSTVSMTNGAAEVAGLVFVNTNLAAACATVAVMLITWIRYKKPDVSMTLNGSLAGLVAITAGCDAVSPMGAAIIGVLAGFVVVFGIEFVDKVLKVDDPVGAVGVHGLSGAFGTIMTGVLATQDSLDAWGMTRLQSIGTQALGVLAVAAWCGITATILFVTLKKTTGLRVSAAEEISGLDLPEHGLASAYADFMPMVESDMAAIAPIIAAVEAPAVPVEAAVPVTKVVNPGAKLTKLDIVCKQERFPILKEALGELGVTGMTVTNVLGCGVQGGHTEYYRGVKREVNLLPKVCVEVVVSKVPVRDVVEAAKKALYTGHIGDGKIFVYDVENVIKVRTGEEGYAALQDTEC